jgi:hypothetical protein
MERDRRRSMSLESILERKEGEEYLNEQCLLYGGVWARRSVNDENVVEE